MNTNSSNSIETTNNDHSPQCTQVETDVSFYPQKENSPAKLPHKPASPPKTHSERLSTAVLKDQRSEYDYSLLTADTERIVLSRVKPFQLVQERPSLVDYFKMEDFKEQYEPFQRNNRVRSVYSQDFNEFQYSCDVIYSPQKSYYYSFMPQCEDKISFWTEHNVSCGKEVMTEKKKCVMNEKYFRNVLVFEEKRPLTLQGHDVQYEQQKCNYKNDSEDARVDEPHNHSEYIDKHGCCQENVHGGRLFPCKLCKAVFTTSQGLGGHMSRTHKSVVVDRRKTEGRNECTGDCKEHSKHAADCTGGAAGRGGKRKITKANTQRRGSNSRKAKRNSKRR